MGCKWNLSLDLKSSEIDLIYLDSDACHVFMTANLAAHLQPSRASLSYLSEFFLHWFSVNISHNLKAGKTRETILAGYGLPFPGEPGRGVPSHASHWPRYSLCHLNEMGAVATVPHQHLLHLLASGGQDMTVEGRGAGAREEPPAPQSCCEPPSPTQAPLSCTGCGNTPPIPDLARHFLFFSSVTLLHPKSPDCFPQNLQRKDFINFTGEN